MPYSFPADIQDLVNRKMAAGQFANEDDLLREALLALPEDESDLEAVRDAIAEFEAGDEGVSLEEAFGAIEQRIQDKMS